MTFLGSIAYRVCSASDIVPNPYLPSRVILKQSACLAVSEAGLDVSALLQHCFVLLHSHPKGEATSTVGHHEGKCCHEVYSAELTALLCMLSAKPGKQDTADSWRHCRQLTAWVSNSAEPHQQQQPCRMHFGNL